MKSSPLFFFRCCIYRGSKRELCCSSTYLLCWPAFFGVLFPFLNEPGGAPRYVAMDGWDIGVVWGLVCVVVGMFFFGVLCLIAAALVYDLCVLIMDIFNDAYLG